MCNFIRKGFTLLELLFAFAIITTLAAGVAGVYAICHFIGKVW